MPFSAMLTIAMVCAAVVLASREAKNLPSFRKHRGSPGSCSGFSRARGSRESPAGIILVGGAVFFWALFTKRWREAFRLFHPVALASFFSTALPWYILVRPAQSRLLPHLHRRAQFQALPDARIPTHPAFLVLRPDSASRFPPLDAWIPRLVFQEQANRQGASCGWAAKFLLPQFGLFPLLFFSISRSKLPGYILPAMAPLTCLLVARVAEAVHQNNRSKQMSFCFLR